MYREGNGMRSGDVRKTNETECKIRGEKGMRSALK